MRNFSGTLLKAAVGDLDIEVVATNIASASFVITVNDVLVVFQAPAPLSAAEEAAFSYVIP